MCPRIVPEISHLFIFISRGDDKHIKRLTTASYQNDVFRMLKKHQSFTRTCIWRFHREMSPTKVLSIRGVEGHLGVDAPKIGNRMMVHALIKFDTEQVSVVLFYARLCDLIRCRASKYMINVA